MIGDVIELEERQERMERVMQILGITPEYPFTVNINDGTRNRVMLGLVDGDYGIKIVDNAGNEILLANGTIIANAIKSGTLDCSLITVANLNAGSITAGSLSASRISGGTLNCSLMTVSNLNAGSITVGTFANPNDRFSDTSIHGNKIQTGTINANRIVAESITSSQIATHSLSGDDIAFGTLSGDHLNVRTIQADRIQTSSLTTTEINYMSGSKLTGNSVYGDRIVNSASLGGLVTCSSLYTPNGIAIGVAASYQGILLASGKNISWSSGEGNIYNINSVDGYNDLTLKCTGSNKILFDSTENGNDLSMYPKWGDFYATGTKYFRIKHPDHPDEGWIQYVSVESPEVALKIRGVAKLNSGEATITLPHHWVLVTEEFLTTVQLTPLEDCNGIFAPKSSLKNTSFVVKELQSGTSDAEFAWELTCTRKGYTDFDPEQTVEAEIKKHAKALKESPIESETKVEYMVRVQAKIDERENFRKEVLKEYKKITGKDYVNKARIWQEEKLGIQEAIKEGDRLIKERDEKMALAEEVIKDEN